MDFSTATLHCKMSEASSDASSDASRDGLALLASPHGSSAGLRSLDVSDADNAASTDEVS